MSEIHSNTHVETWYDKQTAYIYKELTRKTTHFASAIYLKILIIFAFPLFDLLPYSSLTCHHWSPSISCDLAHDMLFPGACQVMGRNSISLSGPWWYSPPLWPWLCSYHLSTGCCILPGHTPLIWSQRITPVVWFLSLEWLNTTAWERRRSTVCKLCKKVQWEVMVHNLMKLCNASAPLLYLEYLSGIFLACKTLPNPPL